MEGSAKITFSCWLLSHGYVNGFWNPFRPGLETSLGSNLRSEENSKEADRKYRYKKGSDAIYYPPPHRNYWF